MVSGLVTEHDKVTIKSLYSHSIVEWQRAERLRYGLKNLPSVWFRTVVFRNFQLHLNGEDSENILMVSMTFLSHHLHITNRDSRFMKKSIHVACACVCVEPLNSNNYALQNPTPFIDHINFYQSTSDKQVVIIIYICNVHEIIIRNSWVCCNKIRLANVNSTRFGFHTSFSFIFV